MWETSADGGAVTVAGFADTLFRQGRAAQRRHDGATGEDQDPIAEFCQLLMIVAPKGCIANPIFPAPTIARFAPGNIIADTLMKALAPAVPELVSAGVANLKAVTFAGFEGERQWVHIEIFEGSYGGRHGKDGMDSVDTLYANTRNNPIEDIESHVPIRVTRYEFREDALAAGQFRGGMNSVKEMLILTDGSVSVEGDGHAHAPWGFLGGENGHTSKLELIREGKAPIDLPSMLPTIVVKGGDRIRATGGVGGGYGDPLCRAAEQVAEDVLDGYLSIDAAAKSFGVVLSKTGEVEAGSTAAFREQMRSARPSTS
jgi:N-methylhydantoinase B